MQNTSQKFELLAFSCRPAATLSPCACASPDTSRGAGCPTPGLRYARNQSKLMPLFAAVAHTPAAILTKLARSNSRPCVSATPVSVGAMPADPSRPHLSLPGLLPSIHRPGRGWCQGLHLQVRPFFDGFYYTAIFVPSLHPLKTVYLHGCVH